MKKGRILAVMLCCFTIGACAACGPAEDESEKDTFPYYTLKNERKTDGQLYTGSGVNFPSSLWEEPVSERYEALDRGKVKAYFIDSVAGTKVFCYVGIPETASEQNKVPGVVLVHGATGSAFYDWVEAWMDKGYAAIAMDTEGRMPTPATSLYHADYPYQTSVKTHGPVNASFGDSTKPIEEQWAYHALASVIASNSFLAGFEEVDAERIGITGVSYGGFLACLAAGYDDRFAFGAPVYGCLSNAPSAAEFGSYINRNSGAEVWDGLGPLQENRTPMLFVNSDTDGHFAPDSTSRCAAACKFGAMTLVPGLTHGHSQGAEVSEVFAFADEICKEKTPLVRVTEQPEEGAMRVAIPKGVNIKNVKLRYTLEETLNKDTEWFSEDAETDGEYVYYSRENNKKHCYLNCKDDRGFLVSSLLF